MAELGYITDTAYTENFYGHQAPALMAYVAALNGYMPPRCDRAFNYLELGCGNGLTSIALAALHPQGKFYACDFNPQHIAHARELAEAGKVANLTLLEKSFAAMAKETLPSFDFITVHGVWGWVPESVRADIAALIKKKLKPGGLAMVSYNTMPGWAHLEPIRRMMQAYVASLPGDSIEKTRKAFDYVQHLAANKAAYFTMNPAAVEHLKAIAAQDIRYVAHEYITPIGDPFYFPEVHAAMRAIGLGFAGNMAPEMNYVEFAAGPELLPLLKTAPTRVILETHRDFIANTRFRNDLYAAQEELPRALPLETKRLEGLAFSLSSIPEALPLRGTRGSLNFDLTGREPAVRAVHQALSAAPADARKLHEATGGASEEDTLALIQQMVLAGHLMPCPAASGKAGWSPLSSALLDRGVREKQIRVPLPAARSATMHLFELPYAAMIEASGNGRYKDARTAVKGVMKRLKDSGVEVNQRVENGAVATASEETVSAALEQMWQKLHDPAVPETKFLRQQGVI